MKKIVLIGLIALLLFSGCIQSTEDDNQLVPETTTEQNNDLVEDNGIDITPSEEEDTTAGEEADPQGEKEPKQSYALDLYYNRGAVTLLDISLLSGGAPDRRAQPSVGHRVEVLSDTNSLLYDFNFHFPLAASYSPSPDWFDENGNQIYFPETDPVVVYEEAFDILIIPYFPNGHWINMYEIETNELVLVVDISEFAQNSENNKEG